MRLPVLLALCAMLVSLVACQPSYPQHSVLSDPRTAAPAKPDVQYASPAAEAPAEAQPQSPPADPPMANGPPTIIIIQPPSASR